MGFWGFHAHALRRRAVWKRHDDHPDLDTICTSSCTGSLPSACSGISGPNCMHHEHEQQLLHQDQLHVQELHEQDAPAGLCMDHEQLHQARSGELVGQPPRRVRSRATDDHHDHYMGMSRQWTWTTLADKLDQLGPTQRRRVEALAGQARWLRNRARQAAAKTIRCECAPGVQLPHSWRACSISHRPDELQIDLECRMASKAGGLCLHPAQGGGTTRPAHG